MFRILPQLVRSFFLLTLTTFLIQRHRPDALLEQLAAATKAMDNTTDELASQFVQGDMDVARFLATYMPQRNVYHERTLKLAHVTNQQQ